MTATAFLADSWKDPIIAADTQEASFARLVRDTLRAHVPTLEEALARFREDAAILYGILGDPCANRGEG